MPDLVILAAGMGTRYGGLKQLAAVGPAGEAIVHYTIYDAVRAGFGRVILVIRPELEAAFHDRVTGPLGNAVDCVLVHQDLPAGRRKPWGTAQALLCARTHLRGAFAVCNADDFYGEEAHRLMADAQTREPALGALVGYRLGDTLSAAGGVARALCEVDADGFLQRVVEVRDIDEREGALAGVTLDGERRALSPDAIISTNFWGLPAACLDALDADFAAFRARRPGPTDEFLLSTAVDGLLRRDVVRIRVLPTEARFLGITRAPDQGDVASGLRALTAEGRYPHDVVGAMHRPPQ